MTIYRKIGLSIGIALSISATIASFVLSQTVLETADSDNQTNDELVENDLTRFDFFYAGEGKSQNMYIVKSGKIVWEFQGPKDEGEISDAVLLKNGNILFAHQRGVTMIDSDKKVIWKHDAPDGTEIHTAQPIGTEHVVFVQNGNPAKVFVVNIQSGETVSSFPIPVRNLNGVHGQFRRARLTSQGTLMVAHMDLGKVCEYDSEGKQLKCFDTPGVWAVEPLASNNILVCCRSQAIEFDPEGNEVWSFQFKDVPELNITEPQIAFRRPNGNTVINNWFNEWSGEVDLENPPLQAIEVTPEKEVVWMLKSWAPPTALGPSTRIQILDEAGITDNATFGQFK